MGLLKKYLIFSVGIRLKCFHKNHLVLPMLFRGALPILSFLKVCKIQVDYCLQRLGHSHQLQLLCIYLDMQVAIGKFLNFLFTFHHKKYALFFKDFQLWLPDKPKNSNLQYYLVGCLMVLFAFLQFELLE